MNAKRKGDAGELELLHLLEARGIPCRRNQQGPLAGYAGGAGNPDVLAWIGGRPLHVEVKRVERLDLHKAMEQAQNDARGSMLPAVAHRKNREPWLITMCLFDFLALTSSSGAHEDEAAPF